MQSETSSAGGIRMVPLADLAANPDNSKARVAPGDSLDALAASIAEIGVVQPLVIQSREAFVREHPQHAESVDELPWVVLAGHRRLAACQIAGLTEAPVVVRDDLEHGRTDEVMIAENVHREALTPLEEARAYRRIMERQGLSQRKLAKHVGVPQSQISKRLTLLDLPDILHAPLESGAIEIQAGLEVAEILNGNERAAEALAEVHAAHPHWPWPSTAREAVSQVAREVALTRAQEVADAEEIRLVKDPGSKWGYAHHDQVLKTKTAIAKARKAGTLAVAPAEVRHGHRTTDQLAEPVYYTTEKTKPAASPYAEQQKTEARERKKANAARLEALRLVCSSKSFVKASAPWRDRVLTEGLSLGSEVTSTARKLAQHLAIGPTDVTEDWEWRHQLRTHPDQAQLAAVIALVCQEKHTGANHRDWDVVDAEWLAWLTKHGGYTPTPWEAARLEAIDGEETGQ